MAFDAFPVAIQTLAFTRPNTTIYYPAVVGLSNVATQEKMNRRIVQEVQRLINDQIDPQQAPQTEMSGSYEIKTNERNVLSLSLLNYAYTYPSAHGLTKVRSLTFDVQTGKSYTLKELFKPGSDYVKVLSDIIKQQLATLDIPLLHEFHEIRPDQDYYIADKALVIYFQLYEITPYYVGLPAFPISVFEIQDIIEENSPLGRMAVYP